MNWKAECDDCMVSFPATEEGRVQLEAYLNSGPPDKQRALKYGGRLVPCKKHADS